MTIGTVGLLPSRYFKLTEWRSGPGRIALLCRGTNHGARNFCILSHFSMPE
jgi:hypothetical protein